MQRCFPDGSATTLMKGTRRLTSLVSRMFKQAYSGGTIQLLAFELYLLTMHYDMFTDII